ncbi:MAG: ABC transporter substrate-binding protein [Crocinitomicaceae bacterium]
MRILAILFLSFLMACKPDVVFDGTNNHIPIYKADTIIHVEDAKGFNFIEQDSFYVLKVNSLSPKYPFEDSLIFPKQQYRNDGKLWQPSWKKLACQSSTHVTLLNALGKINLIKGMSDIDFMPKDSIYVKLMKQNVLELNQNNSVNIEQLAMLQPDLFLMYPFEWQSKKFKQAHIKTLLISEYLEQTPIARLEWIKFFGLLVGEENLANSIFERTKMNYNQLVNGGDIDKTVFFNLPFKEFWDMPAPNSITVNLFKDAGLTYAFNSPDQANIDNLSFTKEKVWELVYNTDYWVVIANRPVDFSLANLLEEEPVYKTFKAVKQNQVIFCNTGQTSYFTEGILEPEVMLKDILFLTGQIDNHTLKYFQFLE